MASEIASEHSSELGHQLGCCSCTDCDGPDNKRVCFWELNYRAPPLNAGHEDDDNGSDLDAYLSPSYFSAQEDEASDEERAPRSRTNSGAKLLRHLHNKLSKAKRQAQEPSSGGTGAGSQLQSAATAGGKAGSAPLSADGRPTSAGKSTRASQGAHKAASEEAANQHSMGQAGEQQEAKSRSGSGRRGSRSSKRKQFRKHRTGAEDGGAEDEADTRLSPEAVGGANGNATKVETTAAPAPATAPAGAAVTGLGLPPDVAAAAEEAAGKAEAEARKARRIEPVVVPEAPTEGKSYFDEYARAQKRIQELAQQVDDMEVRTAGNNARRRVVDDRIRQTMLAFQRRIQQLQQALAHTQRQRDETAKNYEAEFSKQVCRLSVFGKGGGGRKERWAARMDDTRR
jgi:hypothetical protein